MKNELKPIATLGGKATTANPYFERLIEDHEMMEWCEAHPEFKFDHDDNGWAYALSLSDFLTKNFGFATSEYFPTLRDAIRSAMARCE